MLGPENLIHEGRIASCTAMQVLRRHPALPLLPLLSSMLRLTMDATCGAAHANQHRWGIRSTRGAPHQFRVVDKGALCLYGRREGGWSRIIEYSPAPLIHALDQAEQKSKYPALILPCWSAIGCPDSLYPDHCPDISCLLEQYCL
jgi:hypothetical protein